VLVAYAFMTRQMPDWLQLTAFAIGLFGALILVVPDLLGRLWFSLTCGRFDRVSESENELEMEKKSDESFESLYMIK